MTVWAPMMLNVQDVQMMLQQQKASKKHKIVKDNHKVKLKDRRTG